MDRETRKDTSGKKWYRNAAHRYVLVITVIFNDVIFCKILYFTYLATYSLFCLEPEDVYLCKLPSWM